MSDAHILIVDDDPEIRDVLRIALKQAGFSSDVAGDGAEGLAKARAGRFDLLVLDIGLPRMDGLALCRALRETSQVPVLFLTARDDEIDRVLAFELGGDDYVTKPFSARELVGRIRAILKRARRSGAQSSEQAVSHGVLRVDRAAHACQVNGAPVPLTAREMDILWVLASHPAQVFARPDLVDKVWGIGTSVSDRTFDSHLRNLRAKLGTAGCGDAVETVHGVGVRLGPCRGV